MALLGRSGWSLQVGQSILVEVGALALGDDQGFALLLAVELNADLRVHLVFSVLRPHVVGISIVLLVFELLAEHFFVLLDIELHALSALLQSHLWVHLRVTLPDARRPLIVVHHFNRRTIFRILVLNSRRQAYRLVLLNLPLW